jgi:hypothetical protein
MVRSGSGERFNKLVYIVAGIMVLENGWMLFGCFRELSRQADFSFSTGLVPGFFF